MTDPRTLLAAYAATGSEAAFRELVERYLDLVYSTAVRLVNGDTHRAEDVTQMVFADLARLAASLSPNVMLGGWLHRRAYHVATTVTRNERRRQHREREASEMNAWQDRPEAEFERIAPFLDEAINELTTRDRTAIVLRFFERRDLRAVGAALGSNEDAAQKCVSRAVEKLRAHFVRRGVAVSAAVIVSALAAGAVQAAPAGLASTVVTATLAGAAGSGSIGAASTLTKTFLMKKTVVIAAALLLTTALVTPVTIAKVRRARANAPVTAKDLRAGLVLHLAFDRDETDAGRVTDSSGKGNHGVASGVRWTPEGKNGGAYEFLADGNEIKVPNSPSLNPEHLTLSAWIKTSSADRIWRRIFDKSYSKGYALSVAGDWEKNNWRGLGSLEIGPGTHFILTKTKVADGRWHHLVTTFDGSDEVLYVDGRPEGRMHWNQPGGVGRTDFNLVIGCNRSNLQEEDLGTSFRGLIDEPMVWSRALSEKEVAFLFESQNGAPQSQAAAN